MNMPDAEIVGTATNTWSLVSGIIGGGIGMVGGIVASIKSKAKKEEATQNKIENHEVRLMAVEKSQNELNAKIDSQFKELGNKIDANMRFFSEALLTHIGQRRD